MDKMQFTSAVTTTKSLNKSMNHISDACNQLIVALDVAKNIGDAATYGGGIADSAMNSEFVDMIIRCLLLLKHHVNDLRKHFEKNDANKEDLALIIEHMLHTSDKLKLAMIQNHFFRETFGYLVLEISESIDSFLEKLPIK